MLEILIVIGVVGLDLLLKNLSANIWQQDPLVLIKGVLELTYVENRGAVWGIFQGSRIPFIILTLLFLALLVFFLIKARKKLNTYSRILLALLFAGAVGNLIDRVFLGYVRDMIYFRLIDFPVFNIADSAIVIGVILLLIQTFFMKHGVFEVAEQVFPDKKKKAKDAEAANAAPTASSQASQPDEPTVPQEKIET